MLARVVAVGLLRRDLIWEMSDKVSVAHRKENTVDFLDTLRTGKAFSGNRNDDEQDSETTCTALLAMGHPNLA